MKPVLGLFRQEVAAKRASGASDKDIYAMLAEIENGMRAIGTMGEDQINATMRIYREAAFSPQMEVELETEFTEEERVKTEARKQAIKMLGPFFAAIEKAMAEERKKGMSEAELQSKISEVCAVVEEQHGGKVPDHVLKEMLLMVKEAAMPSLEGPETVH